jgi:catechol 2,3-dioxygenase
MDALTEMAQRALHSQCSQGVIDPRTRLGHVHLAVAELDREIAFYRDVLGLRLHWRAGDHAGLGTGGNDLLRLSLLRGGRRVRGTTGLYHFAILLPSRRALARAIGRLLAQRIANYPTDHVITKTTYLSDAEGNGIEIYAESPEDGTWAVADGNVIVRHADGTPSDGREALDVQALMGELAPDDRLDAPLPDTTRIGHVHLHVADIDDAMHFYRDLLGFGDQGLVRAFGAGMVSAGGYHHHIGFNTWAGEGAPPPPPDALGLRYFTVELPDEAELARLLERVERAGIAVEHGRDGYMVRDPSQNGVLLTAGATR